MKCKSCNARWDGNETICPYCGASTDGTKTDKAIDLSNIGTQSKKNSRVTMQRPVPTVQTSLPRNNGTKRTSNQKKQDPDKLDRKMKKKKGGCLTYIIWIIVIIVVCNVITEVVNRAGDSDTDDGSVTYNHDTSFEFPTADDEYRVDQEEDYEYAYDKNDYLLRYTEYEDNGDIDYACTIEYDDLYNELSETYYYFEDGELAYYYVEEYQDDLVIYEHEYDADDELICTYYYEYDDEGNIVLLEQYDNEGSILSTVIYEYEGDNVSYEYYYDEDGNLEGYYVYSYDEDGNFDDLEWVEADE